MASAHAQKRTGYSARQMLNFADPAVLANVMRGITTHEQGYDPYGAAAYAEAARRGVAAANVTVNQKTEINVNGAGDASKAAQRVRDAQAGVNDALARNLSGVVH